MSNVDKKSTIKYINDTIIHVFVRSLCSLVCKWAYDASSGSLTDHSWCDEFLSLIGLQELTENQYDVLGSKVNAPGQVNFTVRTMVT